MNWDDLRLFNSVAEAGSIAKAARRLGLSHVTVWRRLQQLEESVGVELFDRTSKGYALSSEGSAFSESIKDLDNLVESGLRAIWDGQEVVRGVVNIIGPSYLLGEAIAAKLPALYERHPKLRLSVVLSGPIVEPPGPDVDVALTVLADPPAGFELDRVHEVRRGLFASRDYLARKGGVFSIEDLGGHEFIDFDLVTKAKLPGGSDLFARLPQSALGPRVVFRSSSPYARLAAARRGVGVIFAPEMLAASDPDLVCLADASIVGSYPLAMYVRATVKDEARVAAACEFLHDVLSRLPVWPASDRSSLSPTGAGAGSISG